MQIEAAGAPSPAARELAPRAPAFHLNRGTARLLAWLALAGQAIFVAAWVIAGALEPHYSGVRQPISELAARSATHPWIVNVSFVVLGISVAALSPSLLVVLPRRRAARVAAALFAVAGAALALRAAVPLDCALSGKQCMAQWHAGKLSWHTD